MSDFASLKAIKKKKEARSFASAMPANDSDIKLEQQSRLGSNDVVMDDSSQDITNITSRSTGSRGSDAYLTEEGLYTSFPRDYLEIRTAPGRGRGIYAKTSIKPGQIILSIKPHVTALSNDNLNLYCSKCCAPGENLMRCTGCRVVQYCDSKCQSGDWIHHKAECNALQRWMMSPQGGSDANSNVTIPGDAVRCLARILHRKKKLGLDSVWVKEIEGLQSHRTSIGKHPTARDAQMHSQLAHAVVQFVGITSPEDMKSYYIDSSTELVDIVSKFTTNTFTLSTPTLAPLGVCVSPVVALFNHSCDPNAVVVFPRAGGEKAKEHEPLMQVIALRDIQVGNEIVTSYIDTTLPRSRRQEILKETYYFECRCTLCDRDCGEGVGVGKDLRGGNGQVDLREAMWCPKRCGGVCWVPSEENPLTRCSKCKTPVKDTDAVLDALHVGQQALDKAEALQFSDPPKAIQLTTKLIPILTSAGLHPSSHPLLGLTRLETALLIAHLPGVGEEGREEMDVDVDEQGLSDTGSTSTALVASSSTKKAPPPTIKKATTQKSPPPPPTTTTTLTTPAQAQESLDATIRSATRTSMGLSGILRYGHPMRGVALAELGKLMCVDEPVPRHLVDGEGGEISGITSPGAVSPGTMTPGAGTSGSSTPITAGSPSSPIGIGIGIGMNQSAYVNSQSDTYPPSGPPRLKLALNTLLQARGELMVGFGKEGKVVRDVRDVIVGIEKELGVWREGVGRGVREGREVIKARDKDKDKDNYKVVV